jgi:hypothetical protein
MIDNTTKSIWIKHLQDEIDAAFLYRALAELKISEKRRNIYLQLAVVEDKHTKAWKDLLAQNDILFQLLLHHLKQEHWLNYRKKLVQHFYPE